MNEENYALAERLVSGPYIRQAAEARKQREKMVTVLLSQRRMPEEGWDDTSIEFLIGELAMMDSNNFVENIGVGEREARIVSGLVSKRHYRLGHGIGRSGDITAVQPKAAGSSLMLQLTNIMALEAIKLAGIRGVKSCVVFPMATGMSITLALLAMKRRRPEGAKFVLWPRIDQKSCLKAILTAGLVPVVIENVKEDDELRTDVAAIEKAIAGNGADSVVCVLSTTSCFAPRAPDRVKDIAKVCKEHGIGHIVNNAYGLQASKSTHQLGEALREGRVDAFIQSTDKNFLVPVGGALIAGSDQSFIAEISASYPGRASSSPILDLFITLLSLGSTGYARLLKERKELFTYFAAGLSSLAEQHGERLLITPNNPISLAMTLSSFGDNPTLVGSALFSRCCSGCRVVSTTAKQSIGDLSFIGYGAHCDDYHTPYLTAACALGATKYEVDVFLARLKKVLRAVNKKNVAHTSKHD